MNPLDVARLAAAANGVEADQVVVIQDTNNVVVWLQPTAIIAKVGRWSHSAPALLREHAVARQLAGFGAPVAVPVGSPYTEPTTSMVATLWGRIDSTSDPEAADPAALAACLASVHSALSDVEVELPDFRGGLDLAARRLFDDNAMHRLDDADRELLRSRFRQLRPRVDDISATVRSIHGEPHTGNFIVSGTDVFLIDFETVCSGPIEWDLASLPSTVAAQFDRIDRELLATLRILNSIRVATWCWNSSAESMHAHGKHHLDAVRAASPTN